MDGPTAGNGSWISLPGTEEYSRTVSYWTEVEIVSGMLIRESPIARQSSCLYLAS